MSPELAAQTFLPVELLELNRAPVSPALAPSSSPSRRWPPRPGARLSLDADVDTEALRRVLFALGDL
jgi:transposase